MVEDIAGFVEKRARASSHPIFGKISKETRSERPGTKTVRPSGSSSFHEVSSPSQWNYVDTKSNPANEASRGVHIKELLKSKRWMQGPEFLSQSKENSPEQPSVGAQPIKENDPEVKKAKAFSVTIEINEFHQIFSRFSSWYRLKRFVAWMEG